jgi:hypothetical protein
MTAWPLSEFRYRMVLTGDPVGACADRVDALHRVPHLA